MRIDGIDDAWEAELIDRLNEISDLTGLSFEPMNEKAPVQGLFWFFSASGGVD